MRGVWRSSIESDIELYDCPVSQEEGKNIVEIGRAFVELEPFEHKRYESGSIFNLKLELRM